MSSVHFPGCWSECQRKYPRHIFKRKGIQYIYLKANSARGWAWEPRQRLETYFIFDQQTFLSKLLSLSSLGIGVDQVSCERLSPSTIRKKKIRLFSGVLNYLIGSSKHCSPPNCNTIVSLPSGCLLPCMEFAQQQAVQCSTRHRTESLVLERAF